MVNSSKKVIPHVVVKSSTGKAIPHVVVNSCKNLFMVATGQGKVREKYFFKVREFQNLSGEFEILKIVRENGVLSGKN